MMAKFEESLIGYGFTLRGKGLGTLCRHHRRILALQT